MGNSALEKLFAKSKSKHRKTPDNKTIHSSGSYSIETRCFNLVVMKGKFEVVANAHPAREKQMTLFVFQTLFRFEGALGRSGQYWNDVSCGFYIALLVGFILCWSCWTSCFFSHLIKLLFVFRSVSADFWWTGEEFSRKLSCVLQSY